MPYKNTGELREGDIVLHYGMRILIDGQPLIEKSPNHAGVERFAWPGLVLNADELCDVNAGTYDSYIACHLRGQWWKDRVPLPRRDDWPVVGNHLAMWYVEEAETVEKIHRTEGEK